MGDMRKIRTGRHCTFVMHVHLVFVTKFRHKVFTDAHLRRMEEIMRSVCTDFECELVEFNGEDNHVHLLVNFPPKVAVTKLVNSLKGVSSRRLRLGAPPGRRLGESSPTWYATTGRPTSSRKVIARVMGGVAVSAPVPATTRASTIDSGP
ncbi:IS200/IS605 family transposase [Streptomyces sp. NPDC048254]|uniref:IS200/IS605 family transposase n=1 Tax=Streptomyces sp. NPDC048254 TaxID=3365525 RepID=UPI00371F1FCC